MLCRCSSAVPGSRPRREYPSCRRQRLWLWPWLSYRYFCLCRCRRRNVPRRRACLRPRDAVSKLFTIISHYIYKRIVIREGLTSAEGHRRSRRTSSHFGADGYEWMHYVLLDSLLLFSHFSWHPRIPNRLNLSSQGGFYFSLNYIRILERERERERSTKFPDTICSCNNNLCPVLLLPSPLLPLLASPSRIYYYQLLALRSRIVMERKNKARRRIAPPEYRLRNRAVFYLSIPLLERYVAADVVALRGPTVGPALGARHSALRLPSRRKGRKGARARSSHENPISSPLSYKFSLYGKCP